MELYEKAYLAGFLDGEGAFIVQRRWHTNNEGRWIGYSIYIEVANTHKETIEYISKITHYKNTIQEYSAKGNRKPHWRLKWSGKDAKELINEILPYLVTKKKQAQLLVDFPMKFESNISKEEMLTIKEYCFEEAAKLNKRGK